MLTHDKEFLQRYAEFSGRPSRSAFWWATLANALIQVAIGIAGAATAGVLFAALGGLYALAILVPSCAVGVRRLHDTDRSGWWLLISFVPVIGSIWLLVLMCLPSTTGANRFGALAAAPRSA